MVNHATRRSENDDEIHFLDILTALARQKKILFVTPLVTVSIAIIAAFLIKPVFLSTAVILPPQQQNSGVAAMLASLVVSLVPLAAWPD